MPNEQATLSSIDSQLFTVRVWQEAINVDSVEWRGEVKHLASGRVRYFREWQQLPILLQKLLAEEEAVQ